MVDVIFIILIVVAVFVGFRSHNPKLTPYFVSLLLGFLLSASFHAHLARYINSQTQLDFVFSSVISFAALVLIGAIIFYGCLLIYHGIKPEKSIKLYANFSKINFLSLPILTAITFCLVVTVLAELPTGIAGISTLQARVIKSNSIGIFKKYLQGAGIESDLVNKLGKVSLSQLQATEDVVPLAFKSTSISYDQSVELEMTKKINQERASRGIGKLEYTAKLSNIARDHSIDMLKRRYFAHINLDGESPFDRLHKFGVNYSLAGENLAISNSLDSAISALMRSPTHRANILNSSFNKTGIGIATNQDQVMAITEEFTN